MRLRFRGGEERSFEASPRSHNPGSRTQMSRHLHGEQGSLEEASVFTGAHALAPPPVPASYREEQGLGKGHLLVR